MSILKNGSWKGTLTGATLVAGLALGWNIYHTMTTEHGAAHQVIVEDATQNGAWRAIVNKHLEETEPLKEDYMRTRQQVMLNAQAITVIQTGMALMQGDLRDIRDYIYGARPREPRKP